MKSAPSPELGIFRVKKVLRQPWNALTLQLSLSVRDKQDYVYFACLFRQKRRS